MVFKGQSSLFPSIPPLLEEVQRSLVDIDTRRLSCDEQDRLVSEIDHSLRAFDQAASAMRMKRNECAFVSRLPDELLERIFWNIIGTKRGSLACIHTSHICRRWRAVAIGSSRLWSYVVADHDTPVIAINALLSRAALVPLVAHIRPSDVWDGGSDCSNNDYSDSDQPDSDSEDQSSTGPVIKMSAQVGSPPFVDVLSQMHRFRRLNVHVDNGIADAIATMTTIQAPHLESLTLHVDSYANLDNTPFVTGEFPALKHIKISSCASVATFLPLLRFTVTTFDLLSHRTQDWKAFGQLLDGLRAMPMLETLKLFYVLPSGPSKEIVEPAPVPLPFLKYLHVEGSSILGLTELLRCLQIPANTNMYIETSFSKKIEHAFRLGNSLKSILRHMAQQAGVPSNLPYFASFNLDRSNAYYHLHLWPRPSQEATFEFLPPDDFRDVFIPRGRLHLDVHITEDLELASVLWTTLPLDQVYAVGIVGIPSHLIYRDSSSHTRISCLKNCLVWMKGARDLIVWRWNAYWLKELLSEQTKNMSPLWQVEFLLPQLKRLVLDEVPMGRYPNWSHSRKGFALADIDKPGIVQLREKFFEKTGAEVFRAMFQERKMKGIPLEEVELLNCYGMDELAGHPEFEDENSRFDFGLQGSPATKITFNFL